MSLKREHLVNTALKLFTARGFRAVGIDTILSEAKVAKMTLYKHFSSKDDLVLAVIRRCDERSRNEMIREIERRATDPRDRLLMLFELNQEKLCGNESHGCVFSKAASEYIEIDNPVHVAAAEHKRLIRRYVAMLADQAGADDPEKLAVQLTALLDGAVANMQIGGCENLCDAATEAASLLVDAAIVVDVELEV